MKAMGLDRSAPPPPGKVRPFRFPSFVRHRLHQGLVVWIARHPGAPLLSVDWLAPAGSQHDPAGRAGLAAFTAALLDEGAGDHNAMDIATGIEKLGGQIATSADWDVGYGSLFLLSQHAGAGLGLLAEVMAHPEFPSGEIERLRRLRLSEILRRRHQPGALADEQLAAALYTGTPYAQVPIGTADSLSSVDRDEIVAFYRRHYAPAASHLILVSDREPAELLAQAENALAAIDAIAVAAAAAAPAAGHPEIGAATTVAPPPPAIAPARFAEPRVFIVDRPGAAQTELRLAHVGVPRAHADSTVLSFLNTLLGGKFTSRINLNLRERHGYTYGATSRFAARLGPGPFVVNTAVATESAGAAAREVVHELRRIKEEPVAVDEMEETRSYILGVFPYTLQTISDLARRLADLAVYGLPDDHYDRYLQATAALTREDLLEAARRHLHPDQLAIVAVGPADQLQPQLESFRNIQVRAIDDPVLPG